MKETEKNDISSVKSIVISLMNTKSDIFLVASPLVKITPNTEKK